MKWAAVPITAMLKLGLGALGSLMDPVKRLSFSGS
jgi:hypothetical protein